MSKTVHITFFVHGTSEYNERGIMAGWQDVELSERGKKEAQKLKWLVKDRKFDVVFCADLKRTRETAEIAFESREIISDERLRECNYGSLAGTQSIESTDTPEKALKYVDEPFPDGESYKDVEKRVRNFLSYLVKNHTGKHVAIVDSQAPQLVLEVLLNGKTWEQAIREDWRLKTPKAWQAGWEYILKDNFS